MNLFYKSASSRIAAASVHELVDAGKPYVHNFDSIDRGYVLEVVVTDNLIDGVNFAVTITLRDADMNFVYGSTKCGARNVTAVKKAVQEAIEGWNKANPDRAGVHKRFENAYNQLWAFGNSISNNGEEKALKELKAIAEKDNNPEAVAILTDLLTNDFDYENSGYLISSLECDKFVLWDFDRVYALKAALALQSDKQPEQPTMTAQDMRKYLCEWSKNLKGEAEIKALNELRPHIKGGTQLVWIDSDLDNQREALKNGHTDHRYFYECFATGDTDFNLEFIKVFYDAVKAIEPTKKDVSKFAHTHLEGQKLSLGTVIDCGGEIYIVRGSSLGMAEDGDHPYELVNIKGDVKSIDSVLVDIETGNSRIIETKSCGDEGLAIDLKHIIKIGDTLACGKDECTIKAINDICTVKTSYADGEDEVIFNKWLSGYLYREILTIKPAKKEGGDFPPSTEQPTDPDGTQDSFVQRR